jgi:CHAT domain-containing protein/tetratricopeptide (TPR) repeat protein
MFRTPASWHFGGLSGLAKPEGMGPAAVREGSMRRILAWILFVAFLAGPVAPAEQAFAQQNDAGDPADAAVTEKAEELGRLWGLLQQTQGPEERIALAEQALKLVAELRQGSQERVDAEARAWLWWTLGVAYDQRAGGERADNLERAIAAYEQALQATARDTSAEQWATLQSNLGAAYWNRIRGDRADNMERRLAAFEAALTAFTREATPAKWAETQHYLGAAYLDRVNGYRAENVEKAIAAFEAALGVRTREALPKEWAETQHSLGAAYLDRVNGDRAENVEKAIAAFEAALGVRTREAMPKEWAETQHSLGAAYSDRIRGDRADNMEKAIARLEAALGVRTREAMPKEWAQTEDELGGVYWNRVRGDRADNMEKAIAALDAALSVRTREALPNEWASTQHNLGSAYWNRVRGDRADNMERAIAAFEAALAVFTREATPRDWAEAQNNLGIVYRDRVRGDRSDNLEKAVAAFEAALAVFTRETAPTDWAQAQNNLAIAYRDRIRGDRADNLEMAIAAFEGALTVLTREALPFEWAQAQNNLAIVYMSRIRGERAENQEKAIAAFEAALTVFTPKSLPYPWATAQYNLGIVYHDRVRGQRVENVKASIAAWTAALTHFTRETLPREHLLVTRAVGRTLLEAGKWREAGLVYASARDAFLLLFGQGLDEAEARSLIEQAGPLFGEAAYAAAQDGDAEAALTLASEGRARLMAVALKLQGLALPPDKRRRLDGLRVEVRSADRAVAEAQGVARAAAVERLAALRQELLALVKEADASGDGAASALAQARALLAKGGAVVVPIVTGVGGKVVIVTRGARPSAPAQTGGDTVARRRRGARTTKPGPGATGSDPQGLTPLVLDLPELTTDRLNALLLGDDKSGGWRGAYSINHLPDVEFERRWPEWLAAIDGLGPQLWALLGGRLDAALKHAGVEPGARLVWLPSGGLGILPLGLAQDPAGKRRLADTYEIVYAPSLEALASSQKRIAAAAPATLAAVVNPTGDLEDTEKEGQLVASHFPARARTVLEGAAATPDAVLAALKGRSYWHFASHGSFSWEDARQSALIMHAMAPLSVGRLLEAEGLGRPRLVVLSACETGLYDINRSPDEFIGLPGTFTALGAAGVLGTLWPVSDTATALLIAKFYELHMDSGLPPPTALRRAQLWLRQATNADLQGYARIAARQGRLERGRADRIGEALSTEGLTRSRSRTAVEWIGGNAPPTSGKRTTRTAERLARPYAHPYYWAGFIYTGL